MSVGELFILGFFGKAVPAWLKAFAGRFGLGGVILFDYSCRTRQYDNNIDAPEQVRSLCEEISSLPSSPMLFIDQEGGLVRRLKDTRGFARCRAQRISVVSAWKKSEKSFPPVLPNCGGLASTTISRP